MAPPRKDRDRDNFPRPSSLGYYLNGNDENGRKNIGMVEEVKNVDMVKCGKEVLRFLDGVDKRKELGDEIYLKNVGLVKYVMFMNLKIKYENEFILPGVDVEAVWESHLIRPEKYKVFCEVLRGGGGEERKGVIGHKIELMDCMKVKGRERCKELWKEEYGIEEESEENLPVNLERVKEGMMKLNLKVNEVIQDRDWLKYYREYNYAVKEDKFDLFLEESVKGYYKFLGLCKENMDSDKLEPTYPIDLMWHVHMMHPEEYGVYCRENMMVEDLLVHEPWPERFTEAEMFDGLYEIDGVWQTKYGGSMHTIRDMFV